MLLQPRNLPIVLALLLAACSDGTDQSGGGAGDPDPMAEADIAILTPFAGLYDLTGNWRGDDGDIAFLVIREPDGSPTAAVVLSDVDEFENCSEAPRNGELRVDRFTGSAQVFLNGLIDLNSAVVQRGNDGALTITLTDTNDIDRDGNRSERLSLTAPVIAATEQDTIPARCR